MLEPYVRPKSLIGIGELLNGMRGGLVGIIGLATNRVLRILPGESYSFEGYMNSWPTVTTTVVSEGNRCGIGVNGFTYSSPLLEEKTWSEEE